LFPIIAQTASGMMAGSSVVGTDTPADRVTTSFSGVGTLKGCTGTALDTGTSGTWVLTAAHVIGSSTSVTVYFTSGGTTYSYTTSHIFVHEDYASATGDYDVALVYIPEGINAAIEKYSLYNPSPLSLVGDTVDLVGYGYSGYGDLGMNSSLYGHAYRWGQNVVDQAALLNTGSGVTECAFYIMDFDAPGTYGSVGGSLGNDIETTFCTGDSGGPLLVYSGGEYLVAGVNTLVSSTVDMGKFGTYAYSISTYSVQGWINSTIASVPEPSSLALVAALTGLAAAVVRRRMD
jgi:hypothetical protein